MSSEEYVKKVDPILRAARTLAIQGGLDKDVLSGLYGEVVLGEFSVEAFFRSIEESLPEDSEVLAPLRALKTQLPVEGMPVTFLTSEAAQQSSSGAPPPEQRSP